MKQIPNQTPTSNTTLNQIPDLIQIQLAAQLQLQLQIKGISEVCVR